MWASTRGLANLVGRFLILRPAPSPLSFSFCLFERPSERFASAFSSVRIERARTPPVVNLPQDVELHTGFTRKEETMEGHEWQAQRIVGERQTPSGPLFSFSKLTDLFPLRLDELCNRLFKTSAGAQTIIAKVPAASDASICTRGPSSSFVDRIYDLAALYLVTC